MDSECAKLLQALSTYKHVAPASCERALASLQLFFTQSGSLVGLSQLSHNAIDAIRVLRVFMMRSYGHMKDILEEFDEVAGSIQTQIDNVMFNTELDRMCKF